MVKSDLDSTFRESFSADLHTTAHLFLCGCGVEHKPTSAEPKQLRQRYVLPDGTTTGGGTKSIRLVNFVKNPHFNCFFSWELFEMKVYLTKMMTV